MYRAIWNEQILAESAATIEIEGNQYFPPKDAAKEITGFELLEERLDGLGKHKTGKSCLYINKLTDVDIDVLKGLIKESVEKMQDGSVIEY